MEYLDTEDFKSITSRVSRFIHFCSDVYDQKNANFDVEGAINHVTSINAKEQKELFFEIYENNRDDILEGHTSTQWLNGDNENIIYIDDNIRIDLGTVYRFCCDYSNTCKKLHRKYKNTTDDKKYDLFYPQIFLFLLYSCIECFCNKEDRTQIRQVILEVENYIHTFGRSKREEATSNNPFEGMNGFGDIFSTVFSTVSADPRISSMLKRSNMPIGDIVEKVKSTFSDSSKHKDIPSMITSVMDVIPFSAEDTEERTYGVAEEKKSEVSPIVVVEGDQDREVIDL